MKAVAGIIQNKEMSIREAIEDFSVPKIHRITGSSLLKKVKLSLCLTN
jgi:hypothetical protein